MTTIYDVSKLAGVSLATVSRVINKNAPVNEKTKTKVLEAIAELKYRPSTIAKSLASNRTRSVGVLVSELQGFFYGTLMGTIEQTLRQSDIHVIIAAGHSNAKDEKDAIEFLVNRQCDALILFVESISDNYLIELSKSGMPIVVLGRTVPKIRRHCIGIENEAGGYLATMFLLNQGHKKIAYISGPNWKADAKDRFAGYTRALKEYDLKYNEALFVEGDYLESGGAKAMAQLLQQKSKFTAVICANDDMAAGAMSEAQGAGISIPGELSFVGFDNSSFCRFLSPSLTSVSFPVTKIAETAAHRVLNTVYKQKNKMKEMAGVEVVVRNSVGRLS